MQSRFKDSELSRRKTQSQCLWYDADKGNHFLLNNETGEMKKVHKTGDYIKQFDASLTGAVGYDDRIKRAQNNPGYMPHQPQSLKFNSTNAFYTPQNNKFESYMQMPHPRTQPYFNKERELKLNRRKKLYIKEQENNLEFRSHKNKSAFEYQGIKKNNLGISHLTGTITALKYTQKENGVQILKERQFKQLLEKPETLQNIYTSENNNPKYTLRKKFNNNNNNSNSNRNSIINMSQSQGPVLVINERGLQSPNTTLFQKNISKTMNLQKEKDEKQKLIDRNQNIDIKEEERRSRVNQMRYTDKIHSVSGKTVAFDSINPNETKQLNKYYKLENQRERNLENITTKFSVLDSRTFDKTIKLNLPKSTTTPMTQTFDNLKDILKRKQQEADGFQIPIKKEKQTVFTQGRFINVIPSQANQFHNDRNNIMKNFYDETVEHIDFKKVKSEQNRRDLLKQVIKEKIQNTERIEERECKKVWKQYNPHEIY